MDAVPGRSRVGWLRAEDSLPVRCVKERVIKGHNRQIINAWAKEVSSCRFTDDMRCLLVFCVWQLGGDEWFMFPMLSLKTLYVSCPYWIF